MASELLKHIIGKYLTPYSDRFWHCTRLQRMLWLPGMVVVEHIHAIIKAITILESTVEGDLCNTICSHWIIF